MAHDFVSCAGACAGAFSSQVPEIAVRSEISGICVVDVLVADIRILVLIGGCAEP